jgi:NADH-quinone oxidoreductase subunit H
MLGVSSIAVTLWLGGWLRPFPNWLSGSAWDFAFSLVPGLMFLGFAAMCFLGTVRMPKIPQLRAQTIGLAAFSAVLAAVGLLLLVPGVRERSQDVFWFVAKVACFMYLYIWYRGTFPRYRFDQLMKVGWKVLLPVSLGVLIVTAIVGVRQELWAALTGAAR